MIRVHVCRDGFVFTQHPNAPKILNVKENPLSKLGFGATEENLCESIQSLKLWPCVKKTKKTANSLSHRQKKSGARIKLLSAFQSGEIYYSLSPPWGSSPCLASWLQIHKQTPWEQDVCPWPVSGEKNKRKNCQTFQKMQSLHAPLLMAPSSKCTTLVFTRGFPFALILSRGLSFLGRRRRYEVFKTPVTWWVHYFSSAWYSRRSKALKQWATNTEGERMRSQPKEHRIWSLGSQLFTAFNMLSTFLY